MGGRADRGLENLGSSEEGGSTWPLDEEVRTARWTRIATKTRNFTEKPIRKSQIYKKLKKYIFIAKEKMSKRERERERERKEVWTAERERGGGGGGGRKGRTEGGVEGCFQKFDDANKRSRDPSREYICFCSVSSWRIFRCSLKSALSTLSDWPTTEPYISAGKGGRETR